MNFVLQSLNRMKGGELFVPKIPSYRILDVAKAVAPDAKIKVVGIRPGEKLHEIMVPEDDARATLDKGDYFEIIPSHKIKETLKNQPSELCPEGFCYSSDSNKDWLTVDQIKALVEELPRENNL